MEWLEAHPLPAECQNCREEDCYNCDTAGKRWYLSREDELLLRRKSLVRSIEQAQRKVQEIDRELDQLFGSVEKQKIFTARE